MSYPILFLDVDGVLNRCGRSPVRLEPDLLANLVKIVESTDCQIVLSSTWRVMPNAMIELTAALSDLGLVIHGMTPDLARKHGASSVWVAVERGMEIQAWLDAHGNPPRFAILDDNSDMAHLEPRLVQTDSFHGLTLGIASRVVAMLS